jgi:transposase InsO family protein
MKGTRVRLIRDVVAELKRRRRRRREAHILANRTSVKVHKPGALVVLDAAKVPGQKGGECIVYKDRGSLIVDAKASANKATRASDTLAVLSNLKDQGRLPLVAATDNGSPFVADPVEDFLHQNKVVHLKSLPRVPQQNGSAENAVGDVKGLVKDGATLGDACQILNHCRKRESLDWKTATEFDQEHFEPCTMEVRNEFYNAAKAAIEVAQLGTKNAYEKRKAEREAIFQTMESFSLITRIRGHRHA